MRSLCAVLALAALLAGFAAVAQSALPAGPGSDDYVTRDDAPAQAELGTGLDAELVAEGDNTGFSSEPGEPAHGGQDARASVWWQSRTSLPGAYAVYRTCDSPTPVVVAVYGTANGNAISQLDPKDSSGDACENPVLARFTPGIDAEGDFSGELSVALDGQGGAEGPFELQYSVTAPVATLADPQPDRKVETRRKRVRLRFGFGSDYTPPGGTFDYECRFDRGPWEPCRSSFGIRAEAGRHVFRVRAIDTTLVPGTALAQYVKPAKAVVKVKRIRKQRKR